MIVSQIQKQYFKKLDPLDLDLLICHTIKKEREFILAHPEYPLNKNQESKIDNYVQRRLKNEPLAYITGEKEFYGLNFKVNKHTLIPRPETELMVELALEEILDTQYSILNTIDIGTGSGNIIISILKNLNINSNFEIQNSKFIAIDISKDALKVAKQNAKLNEVNKNIKFLHGNLLDPLIQNSKFQIQNSRILILANLPYLSKEIYSACADNVKKYEPKTALYSPNYGLTHYNKLLDQLLKIQTTSYKLQATIFLEISPEQKKLISPVIKKYFPRAEIEFKKDLAQKWRICKIKIK